MIDDRTNGDVAILEILRGPVRLLGIQPASAVLPVGPSSYLHSGPPLRAEQLPGATRGAVAAALLFEGEVDTPDAAMARIDDGSVELRPCQDHGAAGPLTGVISPSMPVVVVEHDDGTRACTPLHEGDHGGLRAGMFDGHTLERLAWIRDVVGPGLARALGTIEPIDITAMQASSLRRGDECHNRNISSTLALLGVVAPSVARLAAETSRAVFDYLVTTSQLFISLSAAAAKATADALHRTARSGLVTGVGMNGHEFGIRVSGLDGWWTAPSPNGPMVPLDGGDITQAGLGQGDSPIIEAIGLGAFSLTAAPALAQAFGLTVAEAADLVADLRRVVAVDSPVFALPADEWRGAPAVMDVRKVTASGIVPKTTLGFLHRDPGGGRVGVGLVPLPPEPFRAAAEALR